MLKPISPRSGYEVSVCLGNLSPADEVPFVSGIQTGLTSVHADSGALTWSLTLSPRQRRYVRRTPCCPHGQLSVNQTFNARIIWFTNSIADPLFRDLRFVHQ